jgi:putative Holliday junction resolvase
VPASATTDIGAFAKLVPASAALIGLDLGTKTIGVAVSDPGRRVASPLGLIRRRKLGADLDALRDITASSEPGGFVVGLPLNMDGSEGPRAQATRAFARSLGGHFDLPVLFWDERLSTAAVDRVLVDADRSRARRAELVDKMAAAWILQGALDRMRG